MKKLRKKGLRAKVIGINKKMQKTGTRSLTQEPKLGNLKGVGIWTDPDTTNQGSVFDK